MSDSPLIQTPSDPREATILERLLVLRNDLLLLRRDKSTYIKSQDVLPLYEDIVEQVHLLNEVRVEKPHEQNRVDRVLDDCFQLLSLLFLTVGKNTEAPAVYAATSTVKRLLDHLTEAGVYSPKDLESIQNTLDKIDDVVKEGKESYSPHIVKLLEGRVHACRGTLSQLYEAIVPIMSPQFESVHEKLVSILRSIAAANTRQKFPRSEVEDFRNQLNEIESSLKDLATSDTEPRNERGREMVEGLLQKCQGWAKLVLEREGKIQEAFQPTYEKLRNIRNQLENLTLLKAWALRETDLYSYQRELDREDEARVDGHFLDEQGNKADLFTQRTLLYLIRRSYAYIYSLIISSEPVSEALLPIYNQLQTLRRCLAEVKNSGGVSSARELYPYSMKLNSIDNMRVDGKFMVGSDTPEGQGTLNDLLAECYNMTRELGQGAEAGGS